MKLLKSLSVGLMAVAMAGTASAAPTIIHVAGSTAFRAATSIAIIDALGGTTAGGGTGSGTVFAAYDTAGKNITNANSEIYANGTIGSGGTATIIVEATWTGSLAGVVDLVAGTSVAQFLDETNASVISAVNGTNSGAGMPAGTYTGELQIASPAYHTTNNVVQFAMSDSSKSTISKEVATGTLSGTLGTYSSIGALATACNGASVVDAGTSAFATSNPSNNNVAIVTFQWVLGIATSGSAPFTNITQQQARAMIAAGSQPQALFTGGTSSADVNNTVYLTGRNEDSGTRIGALSESQFGVTANPVQWQFGNGSSTYTPFQKFPANSALNTEPQISWSNAGHSGYASGGNVGFALKNPNNAPGQASGSNTYYLGYLGVTDAASTIGTAATALNYNGVAYSPAAVQNGSYSFWTYEHAYRLSSTTGTTTGNFIDTVADLIYNNDADITYSTSTGISHTYNSVTNAYTLGAPGLFTYTVNVNRSATEGLPVSY
jgi:hypothetical protein